MSDMSENVTLFKIGEIVDEIIKQTDLGKRKTFSLDKLDSLVQELKKYGIYWDLKQVYDRLIKRKRSGSERKSGALGPMASFNETLINKDYTRISSILNNDDNEAGSQRAGATITANATNTSTATAATTATATIAATTIATIIATATATTAAATAIATQHTAPFDPTAVLPPLDNSMHQNNIIKFPTLQPDHVMKEQTHQFCSFP
ncbi:hypothetical protein RhiirA5_409379 [Rhizophagus irregularis]|uniref:Uncharacterized protein n=2 Tax=Rhizophagus irregularis TaxID=588596 RepID=A0A2N0Q5V7_9GLOM|nr:hypothetical protein RhiirA5_409379 [Rhizophagus irregularis]CAB4485722.1 unnamed protein product [Rhizophagus irregularis]CAB5186273.1 unnamed protein product [Rhizophagus irregularis]CAB5389188.1 unnamed protein product [Rhizophagus irregularis]